MTRADLRKRFEAFGPVLDISLHFRDHRYVTNKYLERNKEEKKKKAQILLLVINVLGIIMDLLHLRIKMMHIKLLNMAMMIHHCQDMI